MKKSYKILMIIALLAVIGGAIGYYMYQKPVKNFADSKADYTLAASALFNEFSTNSEEAVKKYVTADKTVLVDGIISDTKKNDDGTITIFLKMQSDDDFVSCTLTLDASQKINLADYPKGKSVKIKGQCSGMQELIGKEVIMIRCGISA
jgi:flagellar basal body-associated protein FliL